MPTVYLLSDQQTQFIKIGRATNFTDRYANLRTANPWLGIGYLLETEHASYVEKCMHQRFAHLRQEGEFFDVSLTEATDYLEKVHQISQIIFDPNLEALAIISPNEDLIEPDASDWELITQISELNAEIAAIELKRDALEVALKLKIGESAGIRNMATWATQIRNTFDSARFREENPGVYEQYQRETSSRIFKYRRFLNN
jgi:T5orf172 domain